MTEVLKNQDVNDSNGWDSLAELNTENTGTTWEDVAKLGEMEDSPAGESALGSNEEKIPLIKLDAEELARLEHDEYNLYINQPAVFTKIQRIKQENPKAYLNDLTEQLAIYYDPAYTLDPERIVPSMETLDNLADMYSTLRTNGVMLRADELLGRKPEDISSLRQVFDLASAELNLRESEDDERTRGGLINTILRKLRLRKGRTPEEHLANLEKKQFLVELVERYDPQNTKTESTVELARICGGAAEAGNEQLFKFIRTNLNPNESTDDLLRATEIFQSVPETVSKRAQAQQRSVIEFFYETGGMRNLGEEYLTEVILPLYKGGELSHGEHVLVRTALAQHKSPDEIAKMDYTIRQLLPGLEKSDIKQEATELAGTMLAKAVEKARNQPELVEMSRLVLDEMLPFATQQKSHNQCKYAQGLLNGHLIPRTFKTVQRDGIEKARAELTELLEKCETRVMPLLNESSKAVYGLDWQLANEAYEKDYEEDFTNYLRDDLFPRIHRGDIELGGLLRNTNLRGEDRIKRYEFNCLAAKNTPRELNELLMERLELPTSDALKLEQNRVDALAIENVVIPDHGFIHDEHPMTHNVILAMVEYYDSAGTRQESAERQALQKTIKAMNDYGIGRYGNIGAKAFDLKNYDKIIKGEVSDDGVVTRTYNVPAIDVLRRLEENTRADEIERPILDNQEWQALIDQAAEQEDWRSAGELVEYTNKWLVSKQKQYGLTPAKVEAVAFAERMATLAMRKITEKERRELPYDNVFKEFVRLQELIGGYEGYNEEKFEEFYSGFRRIAMETDERDLREHFARLQHHVLERSRDLVRHYKKNGKARREYMMQSNSLLHELVGLTDVRDARTLRERADQMAMGMAVGADSNS